MLAVADPAFDFFVFELCLDAVLLGLLLLAIFFPRHARPEDDVLAHARGVEARPGGVALFEAELGPGAAFGDAGVDGLFDDGGPDAARGFDFFAVVVEAVRDGCFGAVFVSGDLGRGESVGVVEFFVVGPVGAAGAMLVGGFGRVRSGDLRSYFGHIRCCCYCAELWDILCHRVESSSSCLWDNSALALFEALRSLPYHGIVAMFTLLLRDLL